MKLRKHISNKRMTYIRQLGTDRIIDMQFGTGEVAFHIILELYSRGNIILTDYLFKIVSLLRPFVDGDSHNYAVQETYPINRIKDKTVMSAINIQQIISSSKRSMTIAKALLPHFDFGSSLMEHALIKANFDPETKMKYFSDEAYKNLVKELMVAGELMMELSNRGSKGYVIYETEIINDNESHHMFEFSPCLFIQHEKFKNKCFDSFNEAVDEYFSKVESQKIELKIFEQEKEAMKKVNKIREDQSSRLEELSSKQQHNKKKAELIMTNANVVNQAINILRSAIASQMTWRSIKDLVAEATRCNDSVASLISSIKLEINQISMRLSDPFAESNLDQEFTEVDLDLSLSAYANAKRYYDDKKHAALKEKKTLESQKKALKSAENKARETLKTIKTQVTISKTRKIFWFEKFYWFISSENYLIIGGRDQKQNEIIVKRYMKAGDLYVHADVQGASSIIIKNPSGKPVPPRTLDEAGLMAVCFSNAWSSKILFNAWWVYHNQVSKTAPSGEYLVTGSFMIRGQKNYLLPQHLQLGFSFLFKVDESSVHRHLNERKIKMSEDNSLEPNDTNIAPEEDDSVSIVDDDELVSDASSKPSATTQDSESLFIESQILPESPSLITNMDKLSLSQECNPMDINEEQEEVAGPSFMDYDIDSDDEHNLSKKIVSTNSESSQKSEPHLKDSKYKRGQKSRQKKIKEKYKDQDEEEKQLRMSILKSAGTSKVAEKKNRRNQNKKNDKNYSPKVEKNENSKAFPTLQGNSIEPIVIIKNSPMNEKSDDEDERKYDETAVESNELDMLHSLTGIPHEDDEILFALPIVAPYTSILNNKYKVKMIPGMTKRGKAGRAALDMFLRSKDCTPRERDVMKSVNDQLISRNFPGKVKILIPQSKKK
ncbi:ribosome quality control complex subunit NEMF homolog isoform X2 [Halyomorpha halys]